MNSALLGMICFGNGVIILTFYTIANNRLRKLSVDAFWLGGGILGGLGMVSFGTAWLLLAFSGPYYYLPLLQILGGMLVVLAALLCFWAMIYVGRLRRRKDFSFTLNTQGPYRHVRHPQALAFCGLTLGLGLMTLSQPFLFGFPLWIGFWVLYAHLEEQLELIPTYGSRYQRYSRSTPRLLPALKDWKPFLLQGKIFFERIIKTKVIDLR